MPASSATLAARPYQEVGFVLFFEGWRVAFTNRRELVGEGSGSWIGTSEGDRVVLMGLEQPDSVKHSISLEAGLPADNDISFTIIDAEQLIIQLFDQTTEADQVFERLAPTDDPAPTTLIGQADDVVVPLWDRFINGESIGPDGERRQYQVLPGTAGQLPGYDHAAVNSDQQYLRPSEVTDAARWFDGRRVSLYMIRRDSETGTPSIADDWTTWLDAEESGYGRIWWGTVRSAKVTAREWTFSCEGPGSWLRAGLNRLRPSEWSTVAAVGLDITPEQGYCAIALRYIRAGYTAFKECGISLFDSPDDIIAVPGDSPQQVRESLNLRMSELVNAMGPDAVFADEEGGVADVYLDGDRTRISIRVDENPDVEYGGQMWLVLHEKVWRWLGYDPQQGFWNPTTEYEVPFFELLDYYEPAGPPWNGAPGAAIPAAGYVAAQITTVPLGAAGKFNDLNCDNSGLGRFYRAVNPDGVQVLSEGSYLAVGLGDAPYVGPQTMRPVDDAEIGGNECDSTGFVALRGAYQHEEDEESTTRTTIWKASWWSQQGKFGVNDAGQNTIYLSKQLDPRPFGIGNDKVTASGGWAVATLEWTSVAVFGHNLTALDRAHAVIVRLLLGTGTAEWDGFEGDPDAELTAGANAHPDAPAGYVGNDFEVADLCFGVPAELVDYDSFYAEAAALPDGGYESPLNACRVGRVGPVDGGALLRSLLEPRGWAIGLQGGRYTCFSKARTLDVAESVASLTQDDLDSRDAPYIEVVDLYPLTAIDRLTCTYGQDPISGTGDTTELTGQARDAAGWRRPGNAVKEVDGTTLIPNTVGSIEPPWRRAFHEIWERQQAEFYGAPHVVIEVPVRVDKARDIWPGSIVRFGSPWPASREGVYGLAGRVGRVLATTQDCREALTKKVRLLLQAGDPLTVRRFAPIAQALDDVDTLEERHDAASRTIFCYADAFLHGGASRDVAGFEEPEWLAVGGDAICQGWQHDGRTWAATFGFTLESVDVAGNSLTYKPGTLTGKFWERRWTLIVLAAYDDQDDGSWPRALFGVTCRPSGLFGADDTKGWKFK